MSRYKRKVTDALTHISMAFHLLLSEYVSEEIASCWKGGRTMIYVERITWHPNGEEDKNMRYYIFSLDYYETATKALAGYIRGHWHIGNKRYWHLDVTF